MPIHYGFDVPATPGIYLIRNTITQDTYIGSAVKLSERCRGHFKALRAGTHCNPRLQNSFNKHGQSAFIFEVLELILCKEHLLSREQHYIDTLSPKFNIRPVASSNLGIIFSDETRQRVSKAGQGRTFTEEHRRNIGKARMGIPSPPKTQEGLARVGKANTARKGDPRYKATEATRQKQSQVALNRSADSKRNIREAAAARAAPLREIALTRTEKVCTICDKSKLLKFFGRSPVSLDGRQFRCKECRGKIRRAEYARKHAS